MFEFRLRILDARESDTSPNSFLGIVEGFPEILVHATSVGQVERDAINALAQLLQRIQDREATRIDWDEFPTVRVDRLYLSRRAELVGTPFFRAVCYAGSCHCVH
jgi:hypothetical protein